MGLIIDVSEFNSITDWAAAAKAVELMIIRMGYRGSISGRRAYKKIVEDPKFSEYLSGAKKHGIKYTVYYFTTAITDAEAVEEAAWIRDRIRGLELSGPVFIDTENVTRNRSGRADKLNKSDRSHLLRVLTDHLLSYGIPCGIYSYRSWLQGNVDMIQMDPRVLDNTWVAENPKLTWSGAACLWQYGKQSFPWSLGYIDVNKRLTAFNMEADQMDFYRSVIVNKAKSYMGAATGSAKHKEIVDAYNKYTSTHKGPWRAYKVTYTDAWCATFVSAIAIMCGYTDIIPVECGCPQMITQAKNAGIWKESDTYTPRAGDIILYDWQDSGKGDNTGVPDHIGYVRTVASGSIYVIEGNSGSAEKVAERVLPVGGRYIRGFITPRYTAATPPADSPARVRMTWDLPELHPGDQNAAVKMWQALIGAAVTGVYDDATVAETKMWQKKHGKKIDGWVGRGCWTKMGQLQGWIT